MLGACRESMCWLQEKALRSRHEWGSQWLIHLSGVEFLLCLNAESSYF